jgi:hypothetical protein
MPVTVEWYDAAHRILHYRLIGKWTWDEYYTTLAQGRTMEKTAGHGVCTLNDMRETTHLPDDFIGQARQVSLTRPASTAIAVYVSDDYHFASIYNLIARLYPDMAAYYPLVHTEEDAMALIEAWIDVH